MGQPGLAHVEKGQRSLWGEEERDAGLAPVRGDSGAPFWPIGGDLLNPSPFLLLGSLSICPAKRKPLISAPTWGKATRGYTFGTHVAAASGADPTTCVASLVSAMWLYGLPQLDPPGITIPVTDGEAEALQGGASCPGGAPGCCQPDLWGIPG